MDMKKITANSVSGGKSSAYIAANYPSDIEIFSLVCCNDPKLAHPDKKLMQIANDKLDKQGNVWGEFIGITESPVIIETILDLEQLTGREIKWVRGESFEDIIYRKKMIPNKLTRFCTHEMKLKPIFEWFYKNCDMEPVKIPPPKYGKARKYKCHNPIEMKIGYRYDEKHRVDNFTTDFQISTECSLLGKKQMRNKVFENWRVGEFPLVDDMITVFHVGKYWRSKSVRFADESNCNNCFHKPWKRLQQLYINNPALAKWTSSIEDNLGHTFHHKMSVKAMLEAPIQTGLYKTGFACNSGNCHD